MIRKYLTNHIDDYEEADAIACGWEAIKILSCMVVSVLCLYSVLITSGLPLIIAVLSFAGFLPMLITFEIFALSTQVLPYYAEKSEAWQKILDDAMRN